MITSLKYVPLLVSTCVMMGSVLYKILSPQLKLTYFFRDIILFFVLYFVIWILISGIERVLKNYWKIL